MARRVSIEPDVVLMGGMAFNSGFVRSLERTLEEMKINVLDYPEFVPAEGAAWVAVDRATGKGIVESHD